jgi:single-strand DNA-binding protein
VLIGRLTRDPELKYTPNGTAVAQFTLAVDRNVSANAQGERETDFIDCVAWRQSAEFAANYLHKGRLVGVEGRLQVRRWQAQDGSPRSKTEVVCDRVQGLDRPRQEGEAPAAAGAVGSGPRAGVEDVPDDFEDQDPFAGQV